MDGEVEEEGPDRTDPGTSKTISDTGAAWPEMPGQEFSISSKIRKQGLNMESDRYAKLRR